MEQKLHLILQKLETLDELKQIVLALRDRQEESDAKIEALSMDMNKLHGVVAGHSELLHSIVDTQKRQEKILETLALRSIEQETELREFKRIK